MILIFSLLHLATISLMKKYLFLLFIFLVGTGYAFTYQNFLAPSDIMQVSFLDVGQGDAIYIRTPSGNDVLIDGGPDDTVIQKLHEVMPSFDHDIDLVVATHPDKDHIAGLIQVFENYLVKNFLHSESSSGTSFDTSLKEAARREHELKEIIARRGQRLLIDPAHGIYLDILFPDQDGSHFKETNDASIVSRLVFGSQSFLLTGDSPSSVEQFLVQSDGMFLESSVLKLGHHGSNTSTSDNFLDYVQPHYAIVSAGRNNSYHHPHPTIVSRVTDHGTTLLSTISSGTITFKTDGITSWVH